MEDEETVEPLRPDAVADAEGEPAVSEPTKIIRIASMTRAMLEEVRQAPLDEAGRRRLLEVHERSLAELAGVLSQDLQDEFHEIFRPLTSEAPTESELRVAQAQLVGWLEGLFHGIQASLMSQQLAAQAQLAEVRTRQLEGGEGEYQSGVYL